MQHALQLERMLVTVVAVALHCFRRHLPDRVELRQPPGHGGQVGPGLRSAHEGFVVWRTLLLRPRQAQGGAHFSLLFCPKYLG